jgi:signal transduction histidine kinase
MTDASTEGKSELSEDHHRRRAERLETLASVAPAVQHDLNNAQMVLASNIELLARAVPAEGPPRRQLDRVTEAARRIEVASRSLIAMLRRPAEDQESASPEAALRALEPLLRIVLGARLGLTLAVEANTPAVAFDRGRLDVALVELARALHAAPPAPGAVLELSLRGSAEGVALDGRVPGGVPENETLRGLLAVAAPGFAPREDGFSLSWPKV